MATKIEISWRDGVASEADAEMRHVLEMRLAKVVREGGEMGPKDWERIRKLGGMLVGRSSKDPDCIEETLILGPGMSASRFESGEVVFTIEDEDGHRVAANASTFDDQAKWRELLAGFLKRSSLSDTIKALLARGQEAPAVFKVGDRVQYRGRYNPLAGRVLGFVGDEIHWQAEDGERWSVPYELEHSPENAELRK